MAFCPGHGSNDEPLVVFGEESFLLSDLIRELKGKAITTNIHFCFCHSGKWVKELWRDPHIREGLLRLTGYNGFLGADLIEDYQLKYIVKGCQRSNPDCHAKNKFVEEHKGKHT